MELSKKEEKMPYTVYLKKNEEKRLLAGHSWVFANEVAGIDGKDKNGSLATVRAFDGRFGVVPLCAYALLQGDVSKAQSFLCVGDSCCRCDRRRFVV